LDIADNYAVPRCNIANIDLGVITRIRIGAILEDSQNALRDLIFRLLISQNLGRYDLRVKVLCDELDLRPPVVREPNPGLGLSFGRGLQLSESKDTVWRLNALYNT